MQVLVVDPDRSQQLLLGALAIRLGHEVLYAADGTAAMQMLENSTVSILICNMDLPELSGIFVTRAIRERPFDRYVYLILYTGREPDSAYHEALQAGADDFMAVPVRSRTLDLRLKAAERVLRYDDNLRATRLRLEKANIEITQGLQEANRAQLRLLPQTDADYGNLSVDALFRPANFVSGDMLGVFRINDNCLGFYALDVAGHGVRSAFRAVTLSHTITSQVFLDVVGGVRPWASGRVFLPHRLAEHLNARFVDELDTDDYFSLMCGVVDLGQREVVICQAGHPRGLIVRQCGETAWLGQGGYPVGLLSDAEFVSERVPFEPGDSLVIYSDGISEAARADGTEFGEHNIANTCIEAVASGADIRASMEIALEAWVTSTRFNDDLSLLVVSSGRT